MMVYNGALIFSFLYKTQSLDLKIDGVLKSLIAKRCFLLI